MPPHKVSQMLALVNMGSRWAGMTGWASRLSVIALELARELGGPRSDAGVG